MVLNSNISALNSVKVSQETTKQLNGSTEKLSSGLRINKSADDGSGLGIADNLRTQSTSISQAIDNGNSAAKLLQLADKAMAEQSNILDILKQKLIQAKTDTTSPEGRKMIQTEIRKLLEQIDHIGINTNYNETYLLVEREKGSRDLSYSDVGAVEGVKFHMGEDAKDTVQGPSGIKATSDGLGLEGLYTSELTTDVAGEYMGKIDDALHLLNEWRGDYGSIQKQIESSVRNLMTQETNLKAAESIIRDVDYAKESANFSHKNIISQAGSFTISQSNNIKTNMLNSLR